MKEKKPSFFCHLHMTTPLCHLHKAIYEMPLAQSHLQKIKSLVMCQLHEATSFMPPFMCQLNKPLISVCFTKPLAYKFKPQYQFQYTGQLYSHRKLLNTYIKSCILYLYYSNSHLFFIYHWSKNLKEMPPL